MSSSRFDELRHGNANEVAETVLATTDLSPDDLRAALANALSRIAALETEWGELGQAFAWFNNQVRDRMPPSG